MLWVQPRVGQRPLTCEPGPYKYDTDSGQDRQNLLLPTPRADSFHKTGKDPAARLKTWEPAINIQYPYGFRDGIVEKGMHMLHQASRFTSQENKITSR